MRFKKEDLGLEQRLAYDDVMRGKNVFVTGGGGTGKSVLIKTLVDSLRSQGARVAVAASTGVAAVNIGGLTIHSVLCSGISGNIDELKQYANRKMGLLERADKYLGNLEVLVIDEVSMLTGDYIGMMDWWLRHIRQVNDFFGGVQVVFVGDLLQLPPVVVRDEVIKDHYAYMNPVWDQCGLQYHYLKEVFRQEDPEFKRMLADVRRGENTHVALPYFNRRVGADLGRLPTRLCPKNVQVDKINQDHLKRIGSSSEMYTAEFSGNKNWCDMLAKNCIAPEYLELKIGAPVLFLTNDRSAGHYNGMRGVVHDMLEDRVRVETDKGDVVDVCEHEWSITGSNGRVLATMSQIPLKLAWALTVHKAQGMTLDWMCFEPSGTFAEGQTYVALSRARSLDGLSLQTKLLEDHIRVSSALRLFDTFAMRQSDGRVQRA